MLEPSRTAGSGIWHRRKEPQHAEVSLQDLASNFEIFDTHSAPAAEIEITCADPDSLTVRLDDDPVLPENILDVPFLRL